MEEAFKKLCQAPGVQPQELMTRAFKFPRYSADYHSSCHKQNIRSVSTTDSSFQVQQGRHQQTDSTPGGGGKVEEVAEGGQQQEKKRRRRRRRRRRFHLLMLPPPMHIFLGEGVLRAVGDNLAVRQGLSTPQVMALVDLRLRTGDARHIALSTFHFSQNLEVQSMFFQSTLSILSFCLGAEHSLQTTKSE